MFWKRKKFAPNPSDLSEIDLQASIPKQFYLATNEPDGTWRTYRDMEKATIEHRLKHTASIEEAAKSLGMDVASFKAKLVGHNIGNIEQGLDSVSQQVQELMRATSK